MVYQHLEYQKIDRVMVIDILGPVDNHDKLARLADELNDVCLDSLADKEPRVMVVGGIGENGHSVGRRNLTELVPEDTIGAGASCCSLSRAVMKLDLPLIASINGDAAGQELELALACDMRIATETSRFGFPHIKKGFIPCDGGTQRLPRLVGRAKALEMILTGDLIDAQEAYRIGLVNKIVTSGEIKGATMKMAQEMASRAPFSLEYAKEAIYKGLDMTVEQGLRLEADLYFLLHTTRDRAEGIKAFQEKRKPEFKGE